MFPGGGWGWGRPNTLNRDVIESVKRKWGKIPVISLPLAETAFRSWDSFAQVPEKG